MLLLRQRTTTDCGVCALGMALGARWAEAYCLAFPTPNALNATRGVSRERMRRSIKRAHRRIAKESTYGMPQGVKGVMLCVNERDEYAETLHWVAWEHTDAGIVVFDPSLPEPFPYVNRHNRGLRPLEWYAIEP